MADEKKTGDLPPIDNADFTQTYADLEPDFASNTGQDLDFNEPQTGSPPDNDLSQQSDEEVRRDLRGEEAAGSTTNR